MLTAQSGCRTDNSSAVHTCRLPGNKIDIFCRACIASVFRTYYSFRVAQDPDVTFNMIVMTLGASAEISIGIVVSCLPVLPRFSQHLGPKLSRAFSVRSTARADISHRKPGMLSATRLKSLSNRSPVSERHGDRSRSTSSKYWNISEPSEQATDKKYIAIEMEDTIPIAKGETSRTLPPTPAPENACPFANEVERGDHSRPGTYPPSVRKEDPEH